MLSSCNIYRQFERPDVTVDESYRTLDGTTASNDSVTIADLSWTEIYTDTNLQALINYALENNTDLLVAIEKVNEAKASLVSAKLAFLPSVGVSLPTSFSYSSGNTVISYDASVSASWEIDLFGKLLNSKRKAQVALLQNQEYQQAVRTQLIATIADSYFNLLALDKQLNIYVLTEKSWAVSVETIKAMKEGGMANEAAVAQYEAYHAAITAAIPEIKAAILKQENSISALLGNYPETIQRGKLDEQNVDFDIQAGIPMQLLANRPDVKNAEHNLASMYYTTNEAKSGGRGIFGNVLSVVFALSPFCRYISRGVCVVTECEINNSFSFEDYRQKRLACALCGIVAGLRIFTVFNNRPVCRGPAVVLHPHHRSAVVWIIKSCRFEFRTHHLKMVGSAKFGIFAKRRYFSKFLAGDLKRLLIVRQIKMTALDMVYPCIVWRPVILFCHK